jgi:hypothetical protein
MLFLQGSTIACSRHELAGFSVAAKTVLPNRAEVSLPCRQILLAEPVNRIRFRFASEFDSGVRLRPGRCQSGRADFLHGRATTEESLAFATNTWSISRVKFRAIHISRRIAATSQGHIGFESRVEVDRELFV